MYPHRIRLRGPWQCEASAGTTPRRVQVPCRWGDITPQLDATVRLVRSFGYPGQIDAGEHVWLTFSGAIRPTEVVLNEQPLASGEPGALEWDVTSLLGQRNRLELTLTPGRPSEPIWDEVALEVRRDAFLRATARRAANGSIQVNGAVVGAGEAELELYGLADGGHVHYQKINASREGTSFYFEVEDAAAVRLDLVNLSTSWYAVELPIEPLDADGA